MGPVSTAGSSDGASVYWSVKIEFVAMIFAGFVRTSHYGVLNISDSP